MIHDLHKLIYDLHKLPGQQITMIDDSDQKLMANQVKRVIFATGVIKANEQNESHKTLPINESNGINRYPPDGNEGISNA